MKFVVLGGYGIIGSAVVRDLFDSSPGSEIIIAGRDLKKAKAYATSFKSDRVKAVSVNVENVSSTSELLKGTDVCINCTQYEFNLDVMKACLKAKCNYIDLGGLYHMTLKQLKLHKDFRKINRVAILGCGSTPGITNVIAAHAKYLMSEVDAMHISFADWDATKSGKLFVLPYSFKTISEELTMKPALFEHGRMKFPKAGSGNKAIYFPEPFGKQNGFYGLHSELATFPQSFGLKDCSFRLTFSRDFQKRIKELMSSKSEFNKIKDQLLPNPSVKVDDAELVRVEAVGYEKLTLDCITYANKKYNLSAGTWDTAVPASVVAQMITKGIILSGGVYPPEKVIRPTDFFKELKNRKILVYVNGKPI